MTYEIECFNGTRKRTHAGDVFWYKVKGHDMYFYGKLIVKDVDDTDNFFINKSDLIYLYKVCTNKPCMDIVLNPEDVFTVINSEHRGWYHGMFHTIRNEMVIEEEIKLDYGYLFLDETKFPSKADVGEFINTCLIEKSAINERFIATPFCDCYGNRIDHVPKINAGVWTFKPYDYCDNILNRLMASGEVIML
ncbi:MAG: hypothetical protein QM689_07070 [Oscillospiraceae bacterium]